MAAIQGLVGIVALVFGLIGIGLFGSISGELRLPGSAIEVNNAPYYDGVSFWKDAPSPSTRGAGEGYFTLKTCVGRTCIPEDNDEVRATIGLKSKAQEGLRSLSVLLSPALYGSTALAVAGLIGMAAGAGKAAPEVMGAAFCTALVFNLVAFGLACQIAAYTNYGPSQAQIKAGPSLELWSTYFSEKCYSNDWETNVVTSANERCAPGPLTEAALAFAILNCLINIVAVMVSVCGQDMAPKVKG